MAALLSALWPGLGQFSVGSRRAGWLLALPPLALLSALVATLLGPDRVGQVATLVNPSAIFAILLLELVLILWRMAAVADAFRRGQGPARGRGAALTVIAVAFVLGPSLYAAHLTEVARAAATNVFASQDKPWTPTVATPVESDDDFGVQPTASIVPSAAPELGRFTVLLIGMDAGPDRGQALTDTMIVASLDPVAGAVTMVSIPRDLVDAPLPDGRVFRPKVNGLVSYANRHPEKFPGATSGQAVLAASLGQLLNVQVDGWAQVNLPGFVKVIDSLGGIDVTVRKAFCDARYDEYGLDGFAITPGRWHLDGEKALAYARVRRAAGENDFTRAARQGEIVVAARDRVVKGGFLNDPTGFIDAMGALLQTSLDPGVVAEYLPEAIGITRDRMYRAVIQFPLVQAASNDPRGSILVPHTNLIHDFAAQAFPPAGTLPTGLEAVPRDSEGPVKTNLPAVTCYAPAPTKRPAPSALPAPSETSSVEPSESPAETPTATPDPIESDPPGGGPKTPEPTLPPEETAPPP